MINAAVPLPVGTAVKVLFSPPAGTAEVRILRKLTRTFTGYDDPDAFVVLDGDAASTSVIDYQNLSNGTLYYYAEYDLDPAAWWTLANIVSATPNSQFTDLSEDVASVMRSRLEDGLRAYVEAGTLTHDNDYIPVYSAPPLFENAKWPCVTVHVSGDSSEVRGIGEDLSGDYFDPIFRTFHADEGWLSRVRLTLIAWSQNPNERAVLRRALKAVVIGNLPVFESLGCETIDFSISNQEDFETFSSPVYQAVGEFSCLAPSVIDFADGTPISDVTVTATET